MMTGLAVDHAIATFGAEEGVVFRLERSALPAFEAAAMAPAYQVFTRFAGGCWSVRDLETVLSFARSGVAADPAVSRILRTQPPALYAPLALKVLEAALFGLDPALATFDESDREAAA